MCEQPGWKHPRVIDDNQLIAAEQAWQLGEKVIGPYTGHPIEQQHAGGISLRQGLLRYALVREVVVKIGYEHDRKKYTSNKENI